MSEVAGTSPATTRLAALSQSFRSLLLARLGNFLAPAKKPLVIGILQTRFLTLSYSHFDLKPAADQSPTPGLERMLSTFFTSGFTTSRAQSCTAGFTVRFLRVAITAILGVRGKLTGRTLNAERIAPKCMKDSGRSPTWRPVRNKLFRRCTEKETTLGFGIFRPRAEKRELRSWRATPSSMEPRASAPQRVRQGRFCAAYQS